MTSKCLQLWGEAGQSQCKRLLYMFVNTFIRYYISYQTFAPEQISYRSGSMGPADQHRCAEMLPGQKDYGDSGGKKKKHSSLNLHINFVIL